MRIRKRYLRRRTRSRYVVMATCPTCKREEAVAEFQRRADAREWAERKQAGSSRRLEVVREW